MLLNPLPNLFQIKFLVSVESCTPGRKRRRALFHLCESCARNTLSLGGHFFFVSVCWTHLKPLGCWIAFCQVPHLLAAPRSIQMCCMNLPLGTGNMTRWGFRLKSVPSTWPDSSVSGLKIELAKLILLQSVPINSENVSEEHQGLVLPSKLTKTRSVNVGHRGLVLLEGIQLYSVFSCPRLFLQLG